MKKHKIFGIVFGLIVSGIMPVAADSHKEHENVTASTPELVNEGLTAAQVMMTAIDNRDLETFQSFLATTQTPQFTFFWGEQVAGQEALVQWHKEWFEEDGWKVKSMDLLQNIETQDMAYLVFESKFDKSETRKFRILVAIVMVREQSGWKIASSQQTMLEGPTD